MMISNNDRYESRVENVDFVRTSCRLYWMAEKHGYEVRMGEGDEMGYGKFRLYRAGGTRVVRIGTFNSLLNFLRERNELGC